MIPGRQYTIRQADRGDPAQAIRFYDEVCTCLEKGINLTHWKKGEYPRAEDVLLALQEESLYLARDGDLPVGAFSLSRHQPEGFDRVDWGCCLRDEDVRVIEKLAVLPSRWGQNVGQSMMDFILSLARREGLKALRLDVVPGNVPAIRLYERNGFAEIASVDPGLGDFGLPVLKVYQRLL